MSILIQMILDDDSLSQLQHEMGTTEAATPKNSLGRNFIKSSTALSSAPGYNQVEIFLDADGISILKEFGYLVESAEEHTEPYRIHAVDS